MELCCAACGYRSSDLAFFRREPAGVFGGRRTYCDGCRPPRAAKGQVRAYGSVLIFTGLAVIALADPDNSHSMLAGLFLAFAAAFAAGDFLTTIIHEFGHAFAVRLTGGKLFSFQVGSGPVIARWRLGGTVVEVSAHFRGGGGIVHHYGSTRPARWKEACILLGGVAANAVAGALLFLLAGVSEDAHWGPIAGVVLLGLGASEVVAAIWNIIRRSSHGKPLADGERLIALLGSKTFHQDARRTAVLLTASALVRDGRCAEAKTFCLEAWKLRPDEGMLFSMLVHCIGRTDGPAAAVQIYLDHLVELPAPDQIADEGWAYAYGNVAWHALMAGDPAWLEMADALSGRAIAVHPHAPEIRATRGATLIVTGDTESGFPLIRAALQELGSGQDKAEFCACLAEQEDARGNRELAVEFVRLERHLRAAA